jgi:nicotinate-nucleotide--dimethylbenzimidazole phosphoribosyltransferase
MKDIISRKIDEIEEIDKEIVCHVQRSLDNLTKPKGSLGRLEEFAVRYCGARGEEKPSIDKKMIVTFAADHGIAEEGVSAYPREVTAQMVFNFLKGGAGVNVLARHANAEVLVVDIGVDYDFKKEKGLIINKVNRGTGNFAKGSAMSREEALASIECGISVADRLCSEGYQIIGTGEMGIGNTTASSAVISVLGEVHPGEVTGRGTGIEEKAYQKKIKLIEKGIGINKPDPSDPVDVLSKVGGFEIGGIAGLIIGASARRVPVVVDGFISGAGAMIALKLAPKVREYLFFSHLSEEKGHRILFDAIGEKPILDLSLRLGEGTGAALAISLIEAGVKVLKEMATFEEADVSQSNQ